LSLFLLGCNSILFSLGRGEKLPVRKPLPFLFSWTIFLFWIDFPPKLD